MWFKRFSLGDSIQQLDDRSFAEVLDLAYELTRQGSSYRRAIRIAITLARQRARLGGQVRGQEPG